MNGKGPVSLAAGVIIEKDDNILLIYEHGHWGLPKGERQPCESMAETAIREAREETGYHVSLREVVFVTEFRACNLDYYLQVFYKAEVKSGSMQILDPDNEIEKVKYINKSQIREKMRFRPRLLPLEQWINDRKKGYYFYDLDTETQLI